MRFTHDALPHQAVQVCRAERGSPWGKHVDWMEVSGQPIRSQGGTPQFAHGHAPSGSQRLGWIFNGCFCSHTDTPRKRGKKPCRPHQRSRSLVGPAHHPYVPYEVDEAPLAARAQIMPYSTIATIPNNCRDLHPSRSPRCGEQLYGWATVRAACALDFPT